MITLKQQPPTVDKSDIAYADSPTVTCVRPEIEDYTNRFMAFVYTECGMDELE